MFFLKNDRNTFSKLYYIIEALQRNIYKVGDYFVIIADNELVSLIIKKDESAFDELIRRYGGLIKSIVKYHLRDISMWQDDCINDILFAIWQNMDRFDANKNSLKNWIGAVSKYRSINYKRKFYKELTAGELNEDITDGKEIDADLIKTEIDEEIQSLLSALKPVDREIFIQHYIQGEALKDISVTLKKKPEWIYNRLSRGKKKLRRIYAGKGNNCYEK